MAERIRKGDGFSYKIVRSSRKSVAVQLGKDGIFIVRAPNLLPVFMIEDFLRKNKDWILKQQQKMSTVQENRHVITDEERKAGIRRAKQIFPERAAYFAARMGVTYGRITIREQKTRWGSCSSVGNLNFNWKLVLMPMEVLDYVVVHELAHRKEMNHSARFWSIVQRELPDYSERKKLLRKYEKELMN